MNRLDAYKSKAPEFHKLSAGEHSVRLVSYKATDSFHNYDGTVKSNLPQYANPTEQLVITVMGTSGQGGLTHRINMEGFVRYSDLTEKEVKSGKFVEIEGYACAKNSQGQLCRLTDESRTKTCEGILDQFMNATGLPEGSGIDDLDTVIATKAEFNVKVAVELYDDKEQFRIVGFKKAASVTATKLVTSDLEA